MFVSVRHDVADGEAFFSRGQPLVSEAPAGLKPLQFYPSADGDSAVCLWETASLESLREYIDGTLGDASSQTYFAVDERQAMGLPVAA